MTSKKVSAQKFIQSTQPTTTVKVRTVVLTEGTSSSTPAASAQFKDAFQAYTYSGPSTKVFLKKYAIGKQDR